MESTQNRLAWLNFYLAIGPQLPEQAPQEEAQKETFDERFSRLRQESETYSEGFAAGRFSALADLAQSVGQRLEKPEPLPPALELPWQLHRNETRRALPGTPPAPRRPICTCCRDYPPACA